jgi:peptidoglycan/LPS O-acetylase OafA/YrhL
MSREKPAEIRALSGARAIPPLILVLFHFCEGHGYRGLKWFDLIAAKGYLWVEFFFALSGFILIHVYVSRAGDVWRWRGYLQFLQARLTRLYPLHLFMMLVILAQLIVFRSLAEAGGYVSIFDQPYHPILTWQTFVANLFLVQAWNLFNFLSWNGVAWFVSVEFLLCLIFPLYLLLARGGIFIGIATIIGGIAGLIVLDLNSKHGLDLTFHNGIWRGMSAFAVGVGSASLYRAATSLRRKPLPEIVHSTAQVVLVVALLYAVRTTGWSHTHRDILTVLPMLGLVPVLAFDRGLVARLLKTRVPTKLGEWSYAIYIGQTFWLQFLRFAEQRLFPAPHTIVLGMPWSDLFWWIEPALLVVVCICWGALLAAAVERPASDVLKRLAARQGVPHAASA